VINRKARAGIGVIAAVFLAFALLMPFTATASYDNITGVDFTTKFNAQSISASGSATTTSYGILGNTNNQSIQYRGVGTSPNFKVEVLCSLDGTNFVVPEIGGVVNPACTDQNWHVAPLYIPLSKAIQIKITELGGNALASDVKLASQ
jgi:hypothetical protein